MSDDQKPVAHADGTKVRGDASEISWSQEQWRFLEDYLFSQGHSYEQTHSALLDKFGLDVPASTLGQVWKREQDRRRSMQAQILRIREASRTAREFVQEAADNKQALENASLALVTQKLFEALASPTIDLQVIRALLIPLLKARDQGIEERKLKLLEEKAAKAKEALTAVVKKGGLSAEDLARIEEAAALL